MPLASPPVCDFGAPAPDFSLATPSGETHTLATSMGENGLLVMFICNHCPYVVAVVERLVEDVKAMQAAGVGVVAVMSNDVVNYPADAPDRMAEFAEKFCFTFPYLYDETQDVAWRYDAQCTPDFFGFNAKGELQHRGRTPELLNAMVQIAETGEGPREQVPSAGCSIKWK